MGVEFRDARGLICGYRLTPQGAVEVDVGELRSAEPPPSPVWLHFNLNDTRSIDWICGCGWISPEGRDVLLSADASARIEQSADWIAGVLSDQYADDDESFGPVRIYADARSVITGRHHPSAVVRALREAIVGGAGAIDRPTALVNRLVRLLTARFARMIAGYAEVVDDAEDFVLAGALREAALGPKRRAMARLRRNLGADLHALADAVEELPGWWEKERRREMRQQVARLASIAQDLDLVQERARLLTEEIDSRRVERTNRNLYFVSVAAMVFLPITLISGIFGMNVGGLPWVEDPAGFARVAGCMAAAIVVAFAVIYWRRLF